MRVSGARVITTLLSQALGGSAPSAWPRAYFISGKFEKCRSSIPFLRNKFGNGWILKVCFFYPRAEHIAECIGEAGVLRVIEHWSFRVPHHKVAVHRCCRNCDVLGRFGVQWSSNPRLHLCGRMFTGLWYKTCKMNSTAVFFFFPQGGLGCSLTQCTHPVLHAEFWEKKFHIFFRKKKKGSCLYLSVLVCFLSWINSL